MLQGNAADGTPTDTNPGAYIMVGGGAFTDGYEGGINLVAYGDVAGITRNIITFRTRTGVNTIAEVGRFNSSGLVVTGSVSASTTISTGGYTVATLPAGSIGMTAYVTDALAPTFLATVVGGGAVVTPVFYNGTNWIGS